MENVPTGWSPRNAYTRAKCFFLLSSVIVYSRAYGGRGDKAHRPPFRTEVRHGQRPTGMMSAECLYASNECAAQPVGGGAEPIDHRPERSSARKTSPRVRKTAGCRQRSLRRTINHRLHPLLWLAPKPVGGGQSPSTTVPNRSSARKSFSRECLGHLRLKKGRRAGFFESERTREHGHASLSQNVWTSCVFGYRSICSFHGHAPGLQP